MNETERNLIITWLAQGFTTSTIRQRHQLLDSRDEPRFTIAEIDAVAQQRQQMQQPQPQQPQQPPAAIHRRSLQVDQILEEMVNDLASLSGADFPPRQCQECSTRSMSMPSMAFPR
jgi:DNA-binding transcriptional MerR regulator